MHKTDEGVKFIKRDQSYFINFMQITVSGYFLTLIKCSFLDTVVQVE
jgi:hypothetical protein